MKLGIFYLLFSILFGFFMIGSSCNRGEKQQTTPTVQKEKQSLPSLERPKKVTEVPSHPFNPFPARRENVMEILHGQAVYDPYRWLEDASRPEVQEWLTRQNAYARKYLSQLPNREAMTRRLSELSYVDWIGPPVRKGTRYFFSRRHADKEKTMYYWQEGISGTPRVLVDPHSLSTDGSIAVKGVFPSHDGKTAAYLVSVNNADHATLYVMDVATGKLYEKDIIDGARYARPSWDATGKGFYYTRIPMDPSIAVMDLPGHAAVYYHRVGTDPKEDRLVREKTGDPRTFLRAEVSRDGRYLLLFIQFGWTNVDVYFQDLRTSKPQWIPLTVGAGAMFSVEVHRGFFYVLTNHEAPNYRLFKVNPQQSKRTHWKEIVPQQDAVIEDFSVVGNHLALTLLSNASSRVIVTDLEGKNSRELTLPGIGTTLGLVGHPEDDRAFFQFSSFTQPPVVYETSINTLKSKVFFEVKIPFNPTAYTTTQVRYPSKDGTLVSMFLIHQKEMQTNGETPFLLYGYGGFNVSLTPQFSAARILWLQAGGAIAIPNLRGGGEYGENWHRAGMLENKQNVFDDFIAAAEYLIANRYTQARRLAIQGGSNGGLLVGATMVQRPDLFQAVSCHVPLLDMVRYHLFGSGKTWISEYGSADDPQQFQFLYAYSPYHHVKEGTRYPALLMMTADSDDRVDPMHARKFTAAIQHASASANPVLLHVETQAGHGGGDMIKKRIESTVDEFSFLFHQLGMHFSGGQP